MRRKNEYCRKCSRLPVIQEKNKFGLAGGLLLAVLPKCPFCIMAFTSTAVLCGKDTLIESQSTHNSSTTIYLAAFFCLLIIAGILFNFRGIRTIYALTLSFPGVLMIMYSVIRNGGHDLYYSGLFIVFMAVWLNGSLISILKKIKNSFSSISETATVFPYS